MKNRNIKVDCVRFCSAPVGATEYSLQVNSDVVIIGIKGMESMYLKEPITIEFENHEVYHDAIVMTSVLKQIPLSWWMILNFDNILFLFYAVESLAI